MILLIALLIIQNAALQNPFAGFLQMVVTTELGLTRFSNIFASFAAGVEQYFSQSVSLSDSIGTEWAIDGIDSGSRFSDRRKMLSKEDLKKRKLTENVTEIIIHEKMPKQLEKAAAPHALNRHYARQKKDASEHPSFFSSKRRRLQEIVNGDNSTEDEKWVKM